MKKTRQKLVTILMLLTLALATGATLQDKRIRLKNGKSKSNVMLNPSRTYRFVISGKEFTKLSVALKSKGGKLKVAIKSPSGKILSSGYGKRFTVKKANRNEKGDFQIILKNVGKSITTVGLVIGDIKGESK